MEENSCRWGWDRHFVVEDVRNGNCMVRGEGNCMRETNVGISHGGKKGRGKEREKEKR
jgi:hypothetical protein